MEQISAAGEAEMKPEREKREARELAAFNTLHGALLPFDQMTRDRLIRAIVLFYGLE
jgi:hypothetical protein